MLIACEVTVELYMGLAASPQMQVGGQEVEEEGALLWIETEALPLGGALGVGGGGGGGGLGDAACVPAVHSNFVPLGLALIQALPAPAIQSQWVYFGQDGAGPAEVLGEVQAQLLGAYAFIQVGGLYSFETCSLPGTAADALHSCRVEHTVLSAVCANPCASVFLLQDREAEAPAQYRAVQVRPCPWLPLAACGLRPGCAVHGWASRAGAALHTHKCLERSTSLHTCLVQLERSTPCYFRSFTTALPQSYRAAMAVLRQQRAFIASLYERGQVNSLVTWAGWLLHHEFWSG